MNHISVIVWALCMLQSVSAFAPEPSSDEITPVAAEVQQLAKFPLEQPDSFSYLG